MLSSYAKNLRNRFEEGYGEAKIRFEVGHGSGRHSGSSFVAGAGIPDQST